MDVLIYNVDLDWKYAVILKIDEMSEKFNTSLHETFKKLDTDHNASLTRAEMLEFFKLCNIDIPRKDLEDFFNFLDDTGGVGFGSERRHGVGPRSHAVGA